jgi:biotin-(acetyl-CoA carboxylase) ligase
MNICAELPDIYVTDKHFYAFIADRQISGKGQDNNAWVSPPGNLYVSYLVKTKFVGNFYAQLGAIAVY